MGLIVCVLTFQQVKLLDVPEMGFTGTRGELLVRGPNICQGYELRARAIQCWV